MTELFLGVDAGNSKTVAVVGDERGGILGWGRSGLGDIYGAPTPGAAVDEVSRAISDSLSMAGVDLSGTSLRATGAFRLAGVDWPEDELYWNTAIAERFGALSTWSVKNDGFALLRCGDPRGIGVAVSVGTGAAMAGRGTGGAEFVVSWWFQHYLGAAGLGHDGLRAAMLDELGLGETTALGAKLSAFYGVADTEDLLHAFTRRVESLGHRDKARAARVVADAASEGDAVALGILQSHATQLARYIAVTAGRVGFTDSDEAIPVVLGGSVLSAEGSIMHAMLLKSLALETSNARVIDRPNAAPVLGAFLDALAEGGVEITEVLQQNVLARALPVEALST
jgi:N-acetylglucosamine kinase-like BadF-type ATPase